VRCWQWHSTGHLHFSKPEVNCACFLKTPVLYPHSLTCECYAILILQLLTIHHSLACVHRLLHSSIFYNRKWVKVWGTHRKWMYKYNVNAYSQSLLYLPIKLKVLNLRTQVYLFIFHPNNIILRSRVSNFIVIDQPFREWGLAPGWTITHQNCEHFSLYHRCLTSFSYSRLMSFRVYLLLRLGPNDKKQRLVLCALMGWVN